MLAAFLALSLAGSVTIVALGDSTTAGTPGFRSPMEAPPDGEGDERSQYTYWIRRRHPAWRVLNRGINGERSGEILRRFESDVAALKPQVVIVLAGVNDLYQGVPVEQVKRNLAEIYDKAAQQKIRVMACTILPYDSASVAARTRMREVNEWIQATAQERGLGFCDTHRAVEDPARPDRLAGSPDGLHPDVETYRKMGEAIADALERDG